MSTELEAAEEALEAAREALEEAHGREDDLQELIDERKSEAREADERIRVAHEEGADLRELSDVRARRRTARDEASDLREERDHVLDLIARREQAVAEAEIEVARVRWALCREKAEEIGKEVWSQLLEVQDLYDELEALDSSARRHRSVMANRGYEGSWWPEPSQEAGLHRGSGWGSLFSELRRLIRRRRSDAPLPSTGTE